MYIKGQGHTHYGPGTSMVQFTRGMGCCGMGCACGCNKGMGLFDSGTDFTQWGAAEWAIVAIGGYVAFSLVGDLFAVGRGVRYAAGAPGRGYRKAKAKAGGAVRRTRRRIGEAIAG